MVMWHGPHETPHRGKEEKMAQNFSDLSLRDKVDLIHGDLCFAALDMHRGYRTNPKMFVNQWADRLKEVLDELDRQEG